MREPAENLALRRSFVVWVVTDAGVRCALGCPKRENIFPFLPDFALILGQRETRLPPHATRGEVNSSQDQRLSCWEEWTTLKDRSWKVP